MMRTLLIVDDEKNIRLGLKAIIEREFIDQYHFVFAVDGEEALAQLRHYKVDIVITDIRMPNRDGLSFIEQARASQSSLAIIILSGYDDFQYAKTAIKYNVKEYLLKPIVREEMYMALRRVESELAHEEEVAGRIGASEQYRSELRAAELNYMFIHGGLARDEIIERCRRVGLESLEPAFYTGVLRFAGDNSQNIKATQFLCRPDRQEQSIYLEDTDGHLVIMTKEELVLQELMAELMNGSSCPFYMGMSERTDHISDSIASYKQAKHALKYSLFQAYTPAAIIRYEDIRERDTSALVPAEDIRKLSNMIGTDREKDMNALLVKVLDLKQAEHADISYMEGICKQLNELVFDKVFHEYGEESVGIISLYKQVGSIYHFASIHDYFHQVRDLLFVLNDFVRNIRSVHAEHREMKKAVEYIQANYNRDLNMAIVSNHVSLNYSYFSQVFKEYTGQSFVNYLKKVRIEKAKELLEQTEDKVYEIGEKVGFENAKQFIRVFKELEGISALEFRGK